MDQHYSSWTLKIEAEDPYERLYTSTKLYGI